MDHTKNHKAISKHSFLKQPICFFSYSRDIERHRHKIHKQLCFTRAFHTMRKFGYQQHEANLALHIRSSDGFSNLATITNGVKQNYVTGPVNDYKHFYKVVINGISSDHILMLEYKFQYVENPSTHEPHQN